jgi:hypothetical protein
MLAPIHEDVDSDAAHSRDPSPGAGEGRRLDGSSLNGLSGLGAAGVAHQSGVGGLGSQSHGLSADGETQQTEVMTTEVEDEGLGEMYGPPSYEEGSLPLWHNEPGWGFNIINSQEHAQQPHNSEDEHDAGSDDSTRVVGSLHGDEDPALFSSDTRMLDAEDDSEHQVRGVRESAPPPDVVINDPMQADGDDDEDLPVMELRPGVGDELDVNFTNK